MINPTASALKEADLDIMVGATYENIMMVEGEMNEVSEKEMLDAIKFAHAAIKEQCVAQQELAAAVGKEKRTYCHEVNDEELRKDIWDKCYQKAYDVARQCNANTHLRGELLDNVRANTWLLCLKKSRSKKPCWGTLLPRCGKRSDAPDDFGRRGTSGWTYYRTDPADLV